MVDGALDQLFEAPGRTGTAPLSPGAVPSPGPGRARESRGLPGANSP